MEKIQKYGYGPIKSWWRFFSDDKSAYFVLNSECGNRVMDSRAVGGIVADQQKYSLAPFRNRILFVKSDRKDYEYIMMLKYLKIIFPKSDW